MAICLLATLYTTSYYMMKSYTQAREQVARTRSVRIALFTALATVIIQRELTLREQAKAALRRSEQNYASVTVE